MSYSIKLEAALRELEEAKINKINVMPPPYRLLRKLGIEIVPFHYNRFLSNFAIAFTWYIPISFALAFWHLEDISIAKVFAFGLFSGLVLGLCTAAYYSNSAKKHKLSAWDKL
ncbi:DUF6404 family protein [Pseudoalteromonas luteoviolacea]|uniref:Uncharacterized protein n=1 Tax=Pseudoalteromonas luteoviolacea S4060-1 TaxID=1365257 RepID=A0A162CLC1_9GAMM|nr:DUF6404 family protein [Pseudoalteromonas luteoviolacea]KZN70383.1 hypothetical protein N478_00335 [Pseudoalteromonas luteoviolacea S4060-1]